jgi:TonB-linked SusC/RagA family outer membrane protein
MALDVRNEPNQRPSGLRRGLFATAAAVAALALSSLPAMAQTGQITGRVLDAQSGGPLSEVQVYITGLQLGSLSRADGRFLILNVPAGTHTIRAERIGMGAVEESVTVTAGGTTNLDLRMESQALGLDEIVVTGAAGAARRREIGNSITQLDVSQTAERTTEVTNLLQGAAPGIEVTGGSGQLGQGSQIRLRGVSSVGMSNQPIIYVDGVRMMDGGFPRVDTPGMTQGRGARITSSPIDNINPNDIERIEVIKGSAATTLYGTEASAGVIQIFTKRGSTGAPVWTAEVQQGTGWAKKYGVNGVDYMHMEHFLRAPWWGSGYEGGDLSYPCVVPGQGDTEDTASTPFDEVANGERWWGDANSSADGGCRYPGAQWYQTYNLSVRGGSQDLQYFMSGSFQDDTGMMPLDERERYNAQANFSVSPIDDLQIQWSTGFTRQRLQLTPSGNNLSGIELQMMRQERNYMGAGDPRTIAEILDYDHQQWIERLTSGITLNYNPIADLTNRFTMGYDYNQQEGRNLMPQGFWELPQGSVVSDQYQNRVLTFDYVGSYRFPLTDEIRSNFSWGGQAIGEDERRVIAHGLNFPGAAEPTVSSASTRRSEEEREKVWNAGFFFQNVFDISDKYFITLGVRVDGNSAFGEGFGLQTYPKASAAWVISDEAFWPEGLGSVRLRGAYGQSGRAPGTFDAVRTWDPIGFIGRPAFLPENRGNPDLGPEVTSEFELGFEGSWLDDRLSANFTWFHQNTKDALLDVSAIPSLGFSSSQQENVGEMENKGIELQVNGSVIQSADWGLDLGLGISTSHSKMLDLGGIDPFNGLSGRIIEGQPVPVAWDRRVAAENRDLMVSEWDDDLYEDGGENVIIGPEFPTHFVTPTLTLRTPGNIVLSARGEYRGGNVVEVDPIPIGRSVRSPLCFPYYEDPANDITLVSSLPAIWAERCTPGNGDDHWFDGDYFKLRSVSATVPVDFAFPDRVTNAQLTLTIANAYDWYREVPWYGLEMMSDTGIDDEGFADASERTPAPATLRLSLRVTF